MRVLDRQNMEFKGNNVAVSCINNLVPNSDPSKDMLLSDIIECGLEYGTVRYRGVNFLFIQTNYAPDSYPVMTRRGRAGEVTVDSPVLCLLAEEDYYKLREFNSDTQVNDPIFCKGVSGLVLTNRDGLFGEINIQKH